MPRDAAATREQLIDAGQRLFAEQGIHLTPLKQVVEEAGQRNASALHYHFGGRDGLLLAIVARYNDPIEVERAALLRQLADEGRLGDLRSLVAAMIVPFARQLATDGGRQFLLIVSQLVDLFDRWDDEGGRTPEQALRTFHLIGEALPDGLSPAVRHERITRFLELMTEALGTRSRQLRSDRPVALSDGEFVANLIDMSVGALGAPSTVVGQR